MQQDYFKNIAYVINHGRVEFLYRIRPVHLCEKTFRTIIADTTVQGDRIKVCNF